MIDKEVLRKMLRKYGRFLKNMGYANCVNRDKRKYDNLIYLKFILPVGLV